MSKIRDNWGYAVLAIRKALGFRETVRSSCFEGEMMMGYLPISDSEEEHCEDARVFFEARARREGWKIYLYPDLTWPLRTPLIVYPNLSKEVKTLQTREEALAEIRTWEKIGQQLRLQRDKTINRDTLYNDVNVNHIARVDSAFDLSARQSQPVPQITAREGNLVRADFAAARTRIPAASPKRIRTKRTASRAYLK